MILENLIPVPFFLATSHCRRFSKKGQQIWVCHCVGQKCGCCGNLRGGCHPATASLPRADTRCPYSR